MALPACARRQAVARSAIRTQWPARPPRNRRRSQGRPPPGRSLRRRPNRARRSPSHQLASADERDSSDGRATTTMKKATTTMKKRMSGSKEGKGGDSPSQLIDARIKELRDWRGGKPTRGRILLKKADPQEVAGGERRGGPGGGHARRVCP